MYKKAYGIIETLAPLHVGAAAGEESGNLNGSIGVSGR